MGSFGGSDCKGFACNAVDLGWEDPLEKRMATHSSILAWRIPWTGFSQAAVHGGKESETTEQLTHLLK